MHSTIDTKALFPTHQRASAPKSVCLHPPREPNQCTHCFSMPRAPTDSTVHEPATGIVAGLWKSARFTFTTLRTACMRWHHRTARVPLGLHLFSGGLAAPTNASHAHVHVRPAAWLAAPAYMRACGRGLDDGKQHRGCVHVPDGQHAWIAHICTDPCMHAHVPVLQAVTPVQEGGGGRVRCSPSVAACTPAQAWHQTSSSCARGTDACTGNAQTARWWHAQVARVHTYGHTSEAVARRSEGRIGEGAQRRAVRACATRRCATQARLPRSE